MENRFRWARENIKKESLTKVSEGSGLARSLLIDLEADRDEPRYAGYDKIRDLAKYYGVSMDWLCGACAFEDWSLKDHRKEKKIRMATREETRRKIFGWADDILAEHNLFQMLADALPAVPGDDDDMWYDCGDDILCRTADIADALADWLDEHGYDSVTGYFDPADDEREDCVDQLTGWYYVTV